MSAIGTVSATGSNLAGLLPANTQPSSSVDSASSDASNTVTGEGRGPATDVQLSDKVKAILAEAKTDQSVAERLQAFVQSRRADKGEGAQADAGSKTDIDKAFQQLTGGNTQVVDGTQTPSPAQSPAPSPVPSPVEPAVNFSDQAQIAGFSVAVTADAKTGAFTTIINGPDGLSFSDQRFGRGDEVGGSQGVGPGTAVGSYQAGNVEYVTFTQSEAVSVSFSASSDAETVAASAAAAHSYTVTFAIDFTTGSIQATQSDVSTASVTAQVSQGNSPLSVVA
ncbi:MAG TPA: hypothetical protein VNY53_18545 [Bradyrhizobium sp.]|nr:hypothetical protein [Bradyrhizobium sp.]